MRWAGAAVREVSESASARARAWARGRGQAGPWALQESEKAAAGLSLGSWGARRERPAERMATRLVSRRYGETVQLSTGPAAGHSRVRTPFWADSMEV